MCVGSGERERRERERERERTTNNRDTFAQRPAWLSAKDAHARGSTTTVHYLPGVLQTNEPEDDYYNAMKKGGCSESGGGGRRDSLSLSLSPQEEKEMMAFFFSPLGWETSLCCNSGGCLGTFPAKSRERSSSRGLFFLFILHHPGEREILDREIADLLDHPPQPDLRTHTQSSAAGWK